MVLGCLITRVARSGRFWLGLLLAGVLLMVSVVPSAAADGTCLFDRVTGNTTCTFASTGDEQTFMVPGDVSSLAVVAKGAAGASASDGAATGGEGAVVSGTLTVTPGEPLYVEVGGAPTGGDCDTNVNSVGGFNGGGLSRGGGGGGGASDVRTIGRGDTTTTLTSRLLVAAGGGGGGGDQTCTDSTGGAGGNAGDPGMTGCGGGGSGGDPGTSFMGGAGGRPAGTEGGLGVGGGSSRRVGGGGGGGLYGGGSGGEPSANGGGAGGGGGGSSLGTFVRLADRSETPEIAITYASFGEQHAALLASVAGVGPGKSLANKARQIQAAADANNHSGACATLAAFIHEVRAQTGKKLTAEQAASLTMQAENLQTTLSC